MLIAQFKLYNFIPLSCAHSSLSGRNSNWRHTLAAICLTDTSSECLLFPPPSRPSSYPPPHHLEHRLRETLSHIAMRSKLAFCSVPVWQKPPRKKWPISSVLFALRSPRSEVRYAEREHAAFLNGGRGRLSSCLKSVTHNWDEICQWLTLE